MISAENLNKCIDKLATINANTSNLQIKQLTVEIGYILKEELDNVKAWNSQFDNKKMPPLDLQKLMEDNTQLAQENSKLLNINMRLKDTIDEQIPKLEKVINTIGNKINQFNQTINII